MGLNIVTAENRQAQTEPTEETQDSSLTQEQNEQPEVQDSQETTEATAEATQEEVTQEQPEAEQQTEQGSQEENEVVDLTTEVALERLQEDLGRQITLDELRQALSTEPQSSFANDELQKVNDYVRDTGRSVQDYYRTQATDYSSMEDVDVIKELYRQAQPDMPQEELDAFLDVEYKLGGEDDGYSQKEMLAAKAKLRQDAANARQQFNKLKQDYLAPVEQSRGKEPSETDIAQFKEAVSTNGNELGEFEFEGVDWKFGVTDQMRELAIETVSSMSPQELAYYSDENGNVNYFDAVAEKAVIQNLDGIVKNAIEHGKNMAAKEMVTERKNITVPEQQAPAQTTKTHEQKVVDALRGQLGNKRGLRIQTGN